MKAKKAKKKPEPCQCGKVMLAPQHSFCAHVDTGTHHTREKCRPLRGWTDW